MRKTQMNLFESDSQESIKVGEDHQDKLSGHSVDATENGKDESAMVDSLTIAEAAKRCGVSDKTIQRAIRAGTLAARYPQSNRCEIAISDLDTFMPRHVQTKAPSRLAEQTHGHVQTAMEQRLAALEARVEDLERLIADVLSRQQTPKRKRTEKGPERATGPLPKSFVCLLAFARHHNIAEAKVQTHADMGLLPVKRGEWMQENGTQVMLALDAKGRTAFYQLYRDVPHFLICQQCPHGYLDMVSGQG